MNEKKDKVDKEGGPDLEEGVHQIHTDSDGVHGQHDAHHAPTAPLGLLLLHLCCSPHPWVGPWLYTVTNSIFIYIYISIYIYIHTHSQQ